MKSLGCGGREKRVETASHLVALLIEMTRKMCLATKGPFPDNRPHGRPCRLSARPDVTPRGLLESQAGGFRRIVNPRHAAMKAVEHGGAFADVAANCGWDSAANSTCTWQRTPA